MKLRLLLPLCLAAFCMQSAHADKDNRAALQVITENILGQKGTSNLIEFQFLNTGNNAPTSMEVSTTIGSTVKTYQVELDGTVKKAKKGYVAVPVDFPAEAGTYTMTVRINKVNNVDNDASNPQRDATVISLEKFIKRVALLEEYTGTWCGFCPRGYIALEAMGRDMPDDVVCVAYHNDDPMDSPLMTEPQRVSGYPSMYLNREGSSISVSAPHTFIKEACKSAAPAGLSVTATWDDENFNSVTAKATVDFAADAPAGTYAVDYTLVQNGLRKDSWLQSNYYAGGQPDSNDPLWDIFIKGSSYVFDLTFNDVAIANSLYFQYAGAIGAGTPTSPQNDQFTFSGLKGLKGPEVTDLGSSEGGDLLIMDPTRTRVVASLYEVATGKVVNAAICDVAPYSQSGITAPVVDEADADAPVEYYNLQGVKMAGELTPGIYVRRCGNKVEKVVVR